MNSLTPIYCLSVYVAVITHILIFAYKFTGSPEIELMKSRFNPEQLSVYNEIKLERRNHYLIGLGIGLLIAIVYSMKNKNMSVNKNVCAFVGIATFVANIFYELMPKSQWMVEHLDNAGDVKRWNDVYKKFKFLTSYGELLGFSLFALSH